MWRTLIGRPFPGNPLPPIWIAPAGAVCRRPPSPRRCRALRPQHAAGRQITAIWVVWGEGVARFSPIVPVISAIFALSGWAVFVLVLLRPIFSPPPTHPPIRAWGCLTWRAIFPTILVIFIGLPTFFWVLCIFSSQFCSIISTWLPVVAVCNGAARPAGTRYGVELFHHCGCQQRCGKKTSWH